MGGSVLVRDPKQQGWRVGGSETCPGVRVGGTGGQERCAPFLQHHLTLTGRSTAFHFRWKSLVLHLWLFTCRHKPRDKLKNSHRDFWLYWTTPASLEGSETRMKFGSASFVSPNTLGKHLPHPQTAAENMHLVTQLLNSASPLPCPLPAHSPLLPAVLTNSCLILSIACCSSCTMFWYLDSLQSLLRV